MTSKLFLVGLIIIVKFLYGTPPVFNAPIGGTCPTFAKLFSTGKKLNDCAIGLPYAEKSMMIC